MSNEEEPLSAWQQCKKIQESLSPKPFEHRRNKTEASRASCWHNSQRPASMARRWLQDWRMRVVRFRWKPVTWKH